MLGVLWLFMPSSPIKARFLTEEEKVIAIERTAENMYGTHGQESESSDWSSQTTS